MSKSLILAALAVTLVTARVGSASPVWSFHATQPFPIGAPAELVGTCNFAGAGNCTFSLDGGPGFFTVSPASGYTLTSTDFKLDSPVSQTGGALLFPSPQYFVGQTLLHLTLHDDQGVAFAGVPNTPPELSLLEGAGIQFSTILTPTPELYALCPSCGGPTSRFFTIDSITSVPEPVPAAIALVGLLYLAVTRRFPAPRIHSRKARI